MLSEIDQLHLLRTRGIPIQFTKPIEDHSEIISTKTILEEINKSSSIQAQINKQLTDKLISLENSIKDLTKKTKKTPEEESYDTYAKKATEINTLYIIPTNKPIKEVSKDIKSLKCPEDIKVSNIREHDNKIELRTNSETDKNNLVVYLKNNNIETSSKIIDKNPATTKIIFYNIDPITTEEEINKAIKNKLNLSNDTPSIAEITSKINSKNENKEHWIIQLPRYLGQELLYYNSLMIGFNKYYFRKYIRITRCTICQKLGTHSAKDCKNQHFCSTCSSNHHYSECSNKKLCCINCKDHNILNSKLPEEERMYRNQDHSAASPQCPSYRALLKQLSSNF
jgi:hypothetical protein